MRTAVLAGIAGFAITAAGLAVAQPGPGHSVTRAEVTAKVREGFTRADSNNDGFVTQAEGQAAFAARRAERRAQAFDRLDSNKDGQLSRAEFTAGSSWGKGAHGAGHGGGPGKGHAMGMMGFGGRMFAMADVNKDGRVSLPEATNAALQHFDMADANKDGTVTPAERQEMRQRMHPQGHSMHKPS